MGTAIPLTRRAALASGLGAPRDMPEEDATRLQDAMARVIATPDWAERARRLELPVAFLRGADWEAQMPAQEARYRRICDTTPWQ